jgi:hypothetical protein
LDTGKLKEDLRGFKELVSAGNDKIGNLTPTSRSLNFQDLSRKAHENFLKAFSLIGDGIFSFFFNPFHVSKKLWSTLSDPSREKLGKNANWTTDQLKLTMKLCKTRKKMLTL